MNKVIVFLAGLFLAVQAQAAEYKIDAVHSSIAFSVKHMMVSTTPGQFDKFDGTIMYAPDDLANSKITITIPVASINTKNEKRDGHLKAADFFDVEKFPTATFVSKSITATSIVGDLTVKGVTKEITIPATIEGPVTGMGGKDIIGINGSFVFNRQDFGVNWNKILDKGGLALANDVAVTFSIEAGL